MSETTSVDANDGTGNDHLNLSSWNVYTAETLHPEWGSLALRTSLSCFGHSLSTTAPRRKKRSVSTISREIKVTHGHI